jgi:hypothetical protein
LLVPQWAYLIPPIRTFDVGRSGRACRFERNPQFFCAREGASDVPIFGSGIERNQSIAVLAIRLKPVADFLRPLSEYLGAFRAFYFYFFVDHGMPPKKLNEHYLFKSLRHR